MGFLKSLFKPKEEPVRTYADFWNWFCKHEKVFYKAVKEHDAVEANFFAHLSPKLNAIKDGFWYLTGMYDETTAELVITADGKLTNIVFVEELVASAPLIEGWKFTALKPALEKNDVSISMGKYEFNSENMHFYSNDHPNYPDEVDIMVVHDDYNDENKDAIANGVYIFLDNYLGELEFATAIDSLEIRGRDSLEKPLIPIEKLKSYLAWREKEFIEKYEGVRRTTEDDEHAILEAKLESGNMLIATVNTNLLQWDGRASHPWILMVSIPYDGENNNGMPDEETYQRLNEVENNILAQLTDGEGYLNLGRQTANDTREIYFACKEFRRPAKVLHQVQLGYAGEFAITYDIYKDKYWQSFDRFVPTY